MKHTIEQLITIAYRYFPRGVPSDDPRYKQAPEMQRQREARLRAADQYPAWRDMLRRLDKRFPETYIENQSIGLQARTGDNFDRCFAGRLDLPRESPTQAFRYLGFFVSHVAPYYTFHQCFPASELTWDGRTNRTRGFDFVLPDDAEQCATAVAEEIERSFPDHQRMPAEVALTAVPEVAAGQHLYGEAVIFDCLFSDTW